MKFDTLEHGLEAFRSRKSLSAEDLLYIMNLVCASLQMDNSLSASDCEVGDEDEFIEELARQMYNVFFIAEPHMDVIESENDEDLNEIQDKLKEIERQVAEKRSASEEARTLIQQKKTLLHELTALEEEQQQAAETEAELDGKIAEARQWLDAHPAPALDEKRAVLSELKAEAAATEAQMKELTAEIERLTPETAELARKAEEAEQRRDALTADKENGTVRLAQQNEENRALEAAVRESTRQQEEQQKLIELNREELAKENERLTKLETEAAALDEQLKQLGAKIEKRSPEVQELAQRKVKAEQTCETLAKAEQENNVRLTELLAEKQRLEAAIEESKKKQAEQRKLIELTGTEHTEENRKLEKLQAEQAEAERGLSEIKQNRAAAEKEIENIRVETAFYETKLRDGKKTLAELTAEREKLQRDIQITKQVVEKLDAEVSALRNAFGAKTEFRTDLEKEAEDIARSEKKRLQDVKDYMTGTLAALGKEMDETQQAIEEQNSALKRLKDDLSKKHAEHDELSGIVKVYNEEINKLIEEISQYQNALMGFENPEQKKRELQEQRDKLKQLAVSIQDIRQDAQKIAEQTKDLLKQKQEADQEYDLVTKARLNFSDETISEWQEKYTRSHNQLTKLEKIYQALSMDGRILYTDERQRKLLDGLDARLEESLRIVQGVKNAISEYRDSFNR